MTVTSLAAVFCALIYITQTYSVIVKRRGMKTVHGDDGDHTLMKRIRGHSNSAEQMPMFLILLGLTDFTHAYTGGFLALIAGAFMVGRISHAAYFMDIGLTYHFRMYGMILTLTAQIIITLALLKTIF